MPSCYNVSNCGYNISTDNPEGDYLYPSSSVGEESYSPQQLQFGQQLPPTEGYVAGSACNQNVITETVVQDLQIQPGGEILENSINTSSCNCCSSSNKDIMINFHNELIFYARIFLVLLFFILLTLVVK